MKRIVLLLTTAILFGNNTFSQKAVGKLSKYLFNITSYKAGPEPDFTLRDGLEVI